MQPVCVNIGCDLLLLIRFFKLNQVQGWTMLQSKELISQFPFLEIWKSFLGSFKEMSQSQTSINWKHIQRMYDIGTIMQM